MIQTLLQFKLFSVNHSMFVIHWCNHKIMVKLTLMKLRTHFSLNIPWLQADAYKLTPVLPDMGVDRCFLSTKGAELFFYFPIFVLLCFNSLMFLFTVYSLWKSFEVTQFASQSRVSRTSSANNGVSEKDSNNIWWFDFTIILQNNASLRI